MLWQGKRLAEVAYAIERVWGGEATEAGRVRNLPEVLSRLEKSSLMGKVILSMIMISVLPLLSKGLDSRVESSRDKAVFIIAGAFVLFRARSVLPS